MVTLSLIGDENVKLINFNTFELFFANQLDTCLVK